MSQGSPAANQDLLRLLAEPVSAARRPGRPFLASGHSIRVAVALLDAAQVLALGLLTHGFFALDEVGFGQTLSLALMVAVLAAVSRRALRMGTAPSPDSVASVAVRAGAAVIIALLAVLACAWAANPPGYDRAIATLGWALTWAAVSAPAAYWIRYMAHHLRGRLRSAVPALALIGSADATRPMMAAVQSGQGPTRATVPWRLAACVPDSDEELDRLAEMARRGRLDVVAVAMRGQDAEPRIAEICARLADQPVRICVALDLPPGVDGLLPAERLGGIALFDLRGCPQKGWPGTAKRLVDLVLGGTALLALTPLFILVALAIRLESPGSPFFAQWRFGQGSIPVRVWKFRTMYVNRGDATGAQRTLARDPRVTRIGRILRRTSIDELPQLINVVRGEMSLVGPRPHPLHMRVGDSYYFDAVEGYRVRHSVKPGITGWAQINGSRGEIDTLPKAQRRLELDRWYLDNWSLGLDVKIILRTALGGFATSAD